MVAVYLVCLALVTGDSVIRGMLLVGGGGVFERGEVDYLYGVLHVRRFSYFVFCRVDKFF